MFTSALACLALTIYHEARNQDLQGQIDALEAKSGGNNRGDLLSGRFQGRAQQAQDHQAAIVAGLLKQAGENQRVR